MVLATRGASSTAQSLLSFAKVVHSVNAGRGDRRKRSWPKPVDRLRPGSLPVLSWISRARPTKPATG
eukprot:scaffold7339_cov249-Pinguiococcus_pyrenoidosus.AAC.32